MWGGKGGGGVEPGSLVYDPRSATPRRAGKLPARGNRLHMGYLEKKKKKKDLEAEPRLLLHLDNSVS